MSVIILKAASEMRGLNFPFYFRKSSMQTTSIIWYESRYPGMHQVKFFKGCLLQILIDSFLNTLTHIFQTSQNSIR